MENENESYDCLGCDSSVQNYSSMHDQTIKNNLSPPKSDSISEKETNTNKKNKKQIIKEQIILSE